MFAPCGAAQPGRARVLWPLPGSPEPPWLLWPLAGAFLHPKFPFPSCHHFSQDFLQFKALSVLGTSLTSTTRASHPPLLPSSFLGANTTRWSLSAAVGTSQRSLFPFFFSPDQPLDWQIIVGSLLGLRVQRDFSESLEKVKISFNSLLQPHSRSSSGSGRACAAHRLFSFPS